MAPVKCCYSHCTNTNATKSVFSFPINDDDRLKLWIKHSGNAYLESLTHQELKHRFICEDHFNAKDVHKHHARSRLVYRAVPLMFTPVTAPSLDPLKIKTPQKVYTRKRVHLIMQKNSSQSSSMLDAHKRRRLFENNQSEVQQLRRQVQILQEKTKEQQKSLQRLVLQNIKFSNEVSKTFVAMQLREPELMTKRTKAEKELCLSIFYNSPSAYMFLRRQGIIMAPPSTIKMWLEKSNCLPGLQKDIFYNIEKRFQSATLHNKSCVIAFHEIPIISSLKYSKKYDLIEGFQDYGRGDRTPLVAKYVMVFFIRGLHSEWNMPVAYFLSAEKVTADKLKFLVKILINKLFDIGLLPKAIVTEQFSTFRKLFTSLGVSPDTPFFFCNERKIFAFFDIANVLKNIRNHFLNSDLTDGNRIFSFSDVCETYEIDKKNKTKYLHKLTPAHLKPTILEKSKENVSLAAQILSRTVAVAIQNVVGTGELESPTALNTANFILTINNAFDALNSKKRISKNSFNSAITKKNNSARKALLDGKKLLTKLKKIYKKENGATIIRRPPSFDGFLQSIEGVLQLFEEESTDGVKYLITNRLNKDCLEDFFAIFRIKASFNKNPSARLIRTLFKSNFVNSLIKISKSKNCLDDVEDTVTEKQSNKENEVNEKHSPFVVIDRPSTSEQYHLNQTTQLIVSSKFSFDEYSVTYFAGYLAKKCIDSFDCENCKQSLIINEELSDEHELLIMNILYPTDSHIPKLHAPSEALVVLVNTCLDIFEECFENIKHTKNLKDKLYKCIKQNVCHSSLCVDHEDFIINHLLMIKICHFCKSY